jgi:hypothetical protein
LIESGTDTALMRARRLLATAEQFADSRFTWWHVVAGQLEQNQHQDNQLLSDHPKERKSRQIPVDANSFRAVRLHFELLEVLDDSEDTN